MFCLWEIGMPLSQEIYLAIAQTNDEEVAVLSSLCQVSRAEQAAENPFSMVS